VDDEPGIEIQARDGEQPAASIAEYKNNMSLCIKYFISILNHDLSWLGVLYPRNIFGEVASTEEHQEVVL
jgi:hypothetical protein